MQNPISSVQRISHLPVVEDPRFRVLHSLRLGVYPAAAGAAAASVDRELPNAPDIFILGTG